MRLRRSLELGRAASRWEAYEAQDDAFHRTIAEASDNLLLLSLFDQFNKVRRAVAWGNAERRSARPPSDHPSFAQHDAIAEAITSRDPQAAYDAMRHHLISVSKRLFAEV